MRCFFLLVSVLLFGCDTAREFEQNQALIDGVWDVENAISFSAEITESESTKNLYFNLRNDQSYKYSNLYVLSELTLPNGKSEKDTLEFILCDLAGKWLGNTSGSLVTHQIMFQRKVKLPVTGTYGFKFSQIMRDKELKGIKEVGLRVESAE